MLSAAEDAQVALLLEAGTEKPGNVGPTHDADDTTFHQFLFGAVGARRGLEEASKGSSVGECFLNSVRGAANHEGGNTQFGALLLLVPLVSAAGWRGDIGVVDEIVTETTPQDAARFYEAFDHTDVHVGRTEYEYDVNDPTSRERVVEDGVTLYEVMEASAECDGVAREWVEGFRRSFEAGEWISEHEGKTREAVREAYLRLLCEEPDTLVAERKGRETAKEVSERARRVIEAGEPVGVFDSWLRENSVNPGTTADITAAGVFVALRRGWRV